MTDTDAEAGSPLIPCPSRQPLNVEGVRAYASDPFWKRVRTVILLSLFALWVSLLAVAAVGAARKPCGNYMRARRSAGVDGLVYRVEAGAFCCGDSGKGDLRGLITKLNYLVELGVNIVWLSSVHKSPNKNFGLGVEDFQTVDPDLGTLEIFKELVSEMKKRDLKLVIDLVPNHTSSKHIWFQKSIDRIDPYTNYYIWEPPYKFDGEGNPIPPNNWVSRTGGSAWEYNEKRKEFYLHQFSKGQADLNFHNEKVLEEMLNIFTFWLDLGVAGFSLDAAPHLHEVLPLRDELLIGSNHHLETINDSQNSINHINTNELPENLKLLQALRNYVEDYSKKSDGIPRILMTGIHDTVKYAAKYNSNGSKPLVDLLYNFPLITRINSSSSANDVMSAISMWINNIPHGIKANWVIGNYGQKRIADRLGSNMVDGMNMIALLLPGTVITYYGEDIGYHSDATKFPDSKNYPSKILKTQEIGDGHLNVYKQLSKAREEPAIKFGNLETKVLNGSVFAFTRYEPGFPQYLVAVNWSEEKVQVDFGVFDVSERARVYVQSSESPRRDPDVKDIHAVVMEPNEGMVLVFEP
ncbi:maltase 1-like [Hetaerina americana]|uniref:maltase 1-like n=1 Tax=Hetaerina americana TaxID=62018 RepID=UPI003A7F4A71